MIVIQDFTIILQHNNVKDVIINVKPVIIMIIAQVAGNIGKRIHALVSLGITMMDVLDSVESASTVVNCVREEVYNNALNAMN